MYMKFLRVRSTFSVIVKRKIYFLQFTLKDPWFLPRHEKHYKPEILDANIYGWLFFYFGTMPTISDLLFNKETMQNEIINNKEVDNEENIKI